MRWIDCLVPVSGLNVVYHQYNKARELNADRYQDHKPSDVRAKLLSPGGADCLQRMSYSSAVIREALRLWPPAGTARMTVPGAGVTVKTPSGETYPLDGVHVYNCAIIIQRDAAVYGDSADYFVPERWIPGTKEHVEIPVTAWRAFERGPRNCIGQELATLEARVVLALVSKYDFVKVRLSCERRGYVPGHCMRSNSEY